MERQSGGRQKWTTGSSKGTFKRGEGLGTGPVGKGSGGFGSSSGSGSGSGNSSGSGGSSGRRSGGGGSPLIMIIIILFVLFGGGGGILGSLLGGGSSNHAPAPTTAAPVQTAGAPASQSGSGSGLGTIGSLLGSFGSGGASSSSGWADGSNTGVLNTKVADGAREKYTKFRGNGKDTVTVMVYMCGTDLESRNKMGTSDLAEMSKANIADNVNLLVYTGGCKQWQNNIVSSNRNQIYKIETGGLKRLEADMGTASMVKPATLTEFIKYAAKNYPADRYELIFWDHGSGSISGYGYDEKNPSAGSMNLAGIHKALTDGGVKFDFVGFDACLMGTMENALMLSRHADYMIASEETEPGYGWYYTDWLSKLSKNTSMPTTELGKLIIDDFVSDNAKKGQGSSITLSLVDLAELQKTGPKALTAFSKTTGDLVRSDDYQTVSEARSNTREFARSAKLDQVDLVNLALNMGTEEGRELADVVRSAVKYNNTARSMTNAYGLSIYFPYKKVSKVDSAVSTYEAIGMDEEYAKCIKDFASVEVTGQAASGGSAASPLPSLLGQADYSGSTTISSDELLMQLLGSFLGGGSDSPFRLAGLDSSNTNFFKADESTVSYVADNLFNESELLWQKADDGISRLVMSERNWKLTNELLLNCFYDDGAGYIDLGLDYLYSFDDNGNLLGDYDHSWLCIDGQTVAFYFMDESELDGEKTIRGYVPAMLNGERANLLIVFDETEPHGYIAGAFTDYAPSVTETVGKLIPVGEGDVLDFLCDYYSYDGTYEDSYYLGEQLKLGAETVISNEDVGEGRVRATYKLTDIYGQPHWTAPF